jgi:hypothetical protein
VVSLIAFVMTGYGMNPYVVATFNSGLACEYAKSQIVSAALEQTNLGTSTYSMTPRTMKCMALPGLVGSGSLPPDASPPPKAGAAAAAPKKPPVKK